VIACRAFVQAGVVSELALRSARGFVCERAGGESGVFAYNARVLATGVRFPIAPYVIWCARAQAGAPPGTVFRVEGCEAAHVNGNYREDGQVDGKPSYKNDANGAHATLVALQ
jgi:hypothetical protein